MVLATRLMSTIMKLESKQFDLTLVLKNYSIQRIIRYFDKRLEELNGKRLMSLGLGDDDGK